MSALRDFFRRHNTPKARLVVGGLVGLELVMMAVSAPAAISALYPKVEPKIHAVSADEAGQKLLRASSVRIADQFEDMKRIVDVVERVADTSMSGADKMRAVTLAARQLQAMTPDDGAKQYDGVYFTSPGDDASRRFAGIHSGLNEDKRDLANAAMRLGRIQNALMADKEDDLSEEMIELEAAISRYEARNPDKAAAMAEGGSPIGVVVEDIIREVQADRLGQHVELERTRQIVEIHRTKQYVEIDREPPASPAPR